MRDPFGYGERPQPMEIEGMKNVTLTMIYIVLGPSQWGK